MMEKEIVVKLKPLSAKGLSYSEKQKIIELEQNLLKDKTNTAYKNDSIVCFNRQQ